MIKKISRFIFSGGIAALTKLILFVALFSIFKVWYLLASFLAFLCSIAVGFYLQKYVTFENNEKENTSKQASAFFLVSLINLLINIAFMYGLVEILKLNEIAAQIITIAIIACWNFFVYQKFVFKVVGQDIL